MEGNTKGAILVVTYERWHTTTYIGVGQHTKSPPHKQAHLVFADTQSQR
ncbi:MAG: hypothetical protein KDC62_11945 [Aequorivita sp.]|nr:hypothetical protein [Aequorivita sp.]